MLPNPQTDDVPPPAIPTLPRYQRVQCLKAHFWKRSYNEYVSELQKRNKWRCQAGEPFQINQLVIVKDDRLPPARWLLRRITELHPGSDGITSRGCPNGKMRLAFNRLVPLPILNHQDDAARPAAC
ncbi:hypothetical protein NE865_10344 [Phthorimaea operculella]|nr:hypothetical protein NE865_10344 [Phthorimaea operculella]